MRPFYYRSKKHNVGGLFVALLSVLAFASGLALIGLLIYITFA